MHHFLYTAACTVIAKSIKESLGKLFLFPLNIYMPCSEFEMTPSALHVDNAQHSVMNLEETPFLKASESEHFKYCRFRAFNPTA